MPDSNTSYQDGFIDETHNVYFGVVEHSNEAIMVTDRQGKLIYVNPAWEKTYGYSKDEAIGQTPRLLRSKHQNEQTYSDMWAQILNPAIGFWKGELINRAKDGREVSVLLSINPYKDSLGRNIGYVGIALNLSQQKNLEAHLAQQDRLATIGELTSGLAHEIGTPIGVIRGRAEMLQMSTTKDPVLQKNLDIIIRQIDRISGLISTLLKLSRSQIAVELKAVSLKSVLEDVYALLSLRIENNKILWSTNIDDKFLVMGDHHRLEQVFINLVINAIHAISKNAASDSTKSMASIRIEAEQTGSKVFIYIEDTGCGIADEVLPRIFDPFFTTKPTDQGTGLGLSLVSRLLDEMKGRISVKTKIGQGTRFTVSLNAPSETP